MCSRSFCVRTFTSLSIGSEFSSKFSSNTRHQCRYPCLESSLLGAVAARGASAAWCAVLNDGMCTRCAGLNVSTHTVSKQHSHKSSTKTRRALKMIEKKTFSACPLTTSREPMSLHCHQRPFQGFSVFGSASSWSTARDASSQEVPHVLSTANRSRASATIGSNSGSHLRYVRTKNQIQIQM